MLLGGGDVLTALHMTIVNVTLPAMMGALGATADQVTWVLTAYIVAEAVTIHLTGWLAGRFGRRRVLLGGIAGFVAAVDPYRAARTGAVRGSHAQCPTPHRRAAPVSRPQPGAHPGQCHGGLHRRDRVYPLRADRLESAGCSHQSLQCTGYLCSAP
jgi:hypothetical protein